MGAEHIPVAVFVVFHECTSIEELFLAPLNSRENERTPFG
jgi:hypothetical protein